MGGYNTPDSVVKNMLSKQNLTNRRYRLKYLYYGRKIQKMKGKCVGRDFERFLLLGMTLPLSLTSTNVIMCVGYSGHLAGTIDRTDSVRSVYCCKVPAVTDVLTVQRMYIAITACGLLAIACPATVAFQFTVNTFHIDVPSQDSVTIHLSYRIFMSNRKRGITRKQRTE